MKGEYKNIVRIACMYAATIIGAGFASGQEILQFFTNYYRNGFYGIIAAGILFSVIGVIVLDRVYLDRIKNYDEFLFPVAGWFLGWFIQIVVTLFMLCLFCVMTAGMASIISKTFSFPFFIAAALTSLFCMIVIMTDIKGVAALSTVITPLLVLGIISAGFYVIISRETTVFSINGYLGTITDNWFFSALIYVSYNSLLSVVFMTGLLPYLKTRRTGIIGAILGGLVLCFIAVILNTAIFLFYPDVPGDMPILSLLRKYNDTLSIVYTAVLFCAMLVSAVTSGYCAIERVSDKTKLNRKLAAAILCAFAVPLSTMGFSKLIALLYPIFGYVGLFLVFLILLQGGRMLIGERKR